MIQYRLAERQILLLVIAQKLAAKRKKNVIKLATRSNSYHIGAYKKGDTSCIPLFLLYFIELFNNKLIK